jgi:hypothetical protein
VTRRTRLTRRFVFVEQVMLDSYREGEWVEVVVGEDGKAKGGSPGPQSLDKSVRLDGSSLLDEHYVDDFGRGAQAGAGGPAVGAAEGSAGPEPQDAESPRAQHAGRQGTVRVRGRHPDQAGFGAQPWTRGPAGRGRSTQSCVCRAQGSCSRHRVAEGPCLWIRCGTTYPLWWSTME